MQFEITCLSGHRHLLEITFRFTAHTAKSRIQVPYWRPGRYMAGNFPKNYIGFKAFENGEPLACRKISSHQWEIDTPVGQEITLQYELSAAELTAGNTYYDPEVLLINPVNSLVYVEGIEEEPFHITLKLPQGWDCATSLLVDPVNGAPASHRFTAFSMQELMDSPILAAPQMISDSYVVDGKTFHMHLCGYIPDGNAGVMNDFAAFTQAQIAAFGSFPVDDYHFLLLFLPSKARHGVEHERSTVIIMGPSSAMDTKEMYNDFLGISSHELYHTWNVKYMRPADWTPYDFTGPSFSRMGYVAEGVTTYMGDWMLWQAGVYTDEEFLQSLSELFQRHLNSEGRHQLSLGDASVDTWVDGYGGGAPGRRVSIYTEGALLALVCDAWLVEGTGGQSGLWKVMRTLYAQCDPEVGITEDDYWNALKAEATHDWDGLRQNVIDGVSQLETYAIDALSSLGLTLQSNPGKGGARAWWGAQVQDNGPSLNVIYVVMDSPASACGLWFGDEILLINGQPAADFLANATDNQLSSQPAELLVRKGYKEWPLLLQPDGQRHWPEYQVVPAVTAGNFFESWKNSLATP